MLGRGRESMRWHGMRSKEVTADEKKKKKKESSALLQIDFVDNLDMKDE